MRNAAQNPMFSLSAAALAAALFLPLSACDRKPATPAAPAQAPAQPLASYTVLGKIEQLRKTPGGPVVAIHHEPIPTFANRAGKAVGMKEMVMDFPVDPALSIDTLAIGDVVKATFVVDWSKSPAHRLTAVEKMPPETPLNLNKPAAAPTPTATPPEAPAPTKPGT
jgi:Cu/Ag efflux protein CusF